MKKAILLVVVALMGLTASAKGFVGGEVGLWRNFDANTTSFKLIPHAGYDINSKWTVGGEIGYGYDYVKGVDVHSFIISPYARYNVVKWGPVSFFADGGFTYAVSDPEGKGSSDAFAIGVKPGVKVKLCDNISFVSHFGFVGYRKNDGAKYAPWESGFGFDFSGNTLTFGMSYDF